MPFSLSHRLLRLYIVVASVLFMTVALAERFLPVAEGAESLRSLGQPTQAELPRGTAQPATSPEALVGLTAGVPLAIPPAPSPTPQSRGWPEWAKTSRSTAFWLRPDARSEAFQLLPPGSIVKVIEGEGNRWRVYYGGDGDEHEAGEGWVNSDDLSISQAPRWVATRRGALLRSSVGADDPLSSLPDGAVLEVLEDRGRDLQILYLGDGRARDSVEGWVQASGLSAAGALLAAETRGVKVLNRSEAAALRQGDGLWLKVPYRSQLDGSLAATANCGPASIGMALETFDVVVSTADLRAQATRLQGTPGPDVGLAIEFLQGVVERQGLRGYDLYAGRDFKRWSLEDVRRHLSQGHPVIPQLRFRLLPGRSSSDYGEDHYVVLSGMRGDDFIYNDSVDSDGPGYGRVMSADTLVRAWSSSYFPYAAFGVGSP